MRRAGRHAGRRAGRSSENSDTVRSCVNSDTFRSVPRGPRLDAPGVLRHVMVRGIGGAPSFGRSGTGPTSSVGSRHWQRRRAGPWLGGNVGSSIWRRVPCLAAKGARFTREPGPAARPTPPGPCLLVKGDVVDLAMLLDGGARLQVGGGRWRGGCGPGRAGRSPSSAWP
jgi:hypothetical protein